jgi:hypothetical protein
LPANAPPGGPRFSVFCSRNDAFPIANPTRHSMPLCHSRSPLRKPSRGACPGTSLGLIRGGSGLSKKEAKMPAWYGCETTIPLPGFPPLVAPCRPCPRILPWSPLHISVAYAENIAAGGIAGYQQHSVLRHFGCSLPRVWRAPVSARTGGRGHHAVLPGEEEAFSTLPIPRGIPVPLCDSRSLATGRDFLRGPWRASRQSGHKWLATYSLGCVEESATGRLAAPPSVPGRAVFCGTGPTPSISSRGGV